MRTERTDRNEWPYTTPSGYTYEIPATYDDLLHIQQHVHLAMCERWEETEHPPQPTWEVVDSAHHEVFRLHKQLVDLVGNRALTILESRLSIMVIYFVIGVATTLMLQALR